MWLWCGQEEAVADCVCCGGGCCWSVVKEVKKEKNWKWVQTAAAVAEAGAGAEVVAQESVRFALIDIPIAMLLTGEIQVGVSGFFFELFICHSLYLLKCVLVRN